MDQEQNMWKQLSCDSMKLPIPIANYSGFINFSYPNPASMKNFIVPIDFSDDSLKGLELAMMFAQKIHVNIQMVYVQKKSFDIYAALIEEEARLAARKFEQLLKVYTPRLKNDSRLRYIVKKGRIYEEIVNQAQSYKESIITASTHGASGFEELFIGSNAIKVIAATDRPVITIRKGKVPKDFKKILLPLDVVPETRQKVMLTAQIAQLFGSEVHVIGVTSSKSKKIETRVHAYSKQVCKHLKMAGIPYKADFLYGENIADLTIDYALKIKADMISIITDMGTNIGGFFMGGYAQQILNKATMPVLNIKPKAIHLPRDFSTFGG
jgi:nucleotide-binding universal stress UspA family protein